MTVRCLTMPATTELHRQRGDLMAVGGRVEDVRRTAGPAGVVAIKVSLTTEGEKDAVAYFQMEHEDALAVLELGDNVEIASRAWVDGQHGKVTKNPESLRRVVERWEDVVR